MDLIVNGKKEGGGRDARFEGETGRCSCPICGSVLPAHEIAFREGLVVANGAAVRLTKAEGAIFELLLKRSPSRVARENVYQAVVSLHLTEADWPGEKILDTHIHHMRRKLGKVGLTIETIHSFGYRLPHGVQAMEAAE